MTQTIKLPVSHPWVAVDLDGTLMEDGHYPGFGPPRDGAKEGCDQLRALGIKIMVFTARVSFTELDGSYVNVPKIIEQVYAWCREHQIPVDYIFPYPKPTYIVAFLDDRAVSVRPDNPRAWPEAVQEIKERWGYQLGENWSQAVLPAHYNGQPGGTT